MTIPRTRLRAAQWLALLVVLMLLLAACGKKDEPTPAPSATIPVGALHLPYIFSGDFTVSGQPGPAGLQIFARLGDTLISPTAATAAGRYNNIIIGPMLGASASGNVTFHLGDPNGASVQAAETVEFRQVAQPTNFDQDLTFVRLP